MAITVNVNGEAINYPQTGDTGWGDEATDFAVQTSSAFAKLGLSTGTTVDIQGTLDVTGNVNLDANLTVLGSTILGDSGDTTTINGDSTLNGTLTVTGNSVLQAISSTGITLNGTLTNNGSTILGDTSADTLTINGTAISTPNGINIDSNTLVVDATNNRIGIVNASPTVALDITGDIKKSGVDFNSDGSVSNPSITFTSDTNTGLYRIGSDNIGVSIGGSKVSEYNSNGILGLDNYLQITEQYTSGTSAGTFTSGAWRTRVLNTVGVNRITGASLASNQITLPAGKYRIKASLPSYNTTQHKSKLYNATDLSDTLIGQSAYSTAGSGIQTDSILSGEFTIAGTKVFELQHRCSSTQATSGFGVASSFSVAEVFTIVEIWRLA